MCKSARNAWPAMLLLAGCAGPPLVPVSAPGFTAVGPNAQPAMTLAEARRHLMNMRATYRQAMASQLSVTQYSTTGLVVLGAAVTGLAAGKAHPDAIVGTALVGGTSYAVANLTLDRRRVLAFDAGIKALDCANNAVIPLDLDAQARSLLATHSQAQARARTAAAARVSDVNQRLDALQKAQAIDAAPLASARQSLATMNAALAEADQTRKAADKLAGDAREVGQRLQNTVNEISARVDGFIAQTVADVSAVPQVLAGLGGFASAFAPGAGVDATLADALARYKKAEQGSAKSANPEIEQQKQALEAALDALDKAAVTLAEATAALHTSLAGVDSAAVVTALKACQVAEVAAPLSLEPASLALEAPTASPKGFAIRGGTKPYTVRWLDGSVDGLSLSFAGGFSDTVQVGAAANVPAEQYRLIVSDASGSGLSRQLVVTVAAKTASAPSAAPATPKPGAGNEALTALVKTLNGLPGQPMQGGTVVAPVPGSAALDAAAQRIDLDLRCTPAKPATKLKRADVFDKLVAAASAPEWAGSKNPLRLRTPNADCLQN